MSLSLLFEKLKSREIKLRLDDGENVKVLGRPEKLDRELLSELRENKDAIIRWLKEATLDLRPPIVRVERRSELLPTSFAQQRLWFIDQLGGGSVQYNIPGAMRIAGRFDEATAERVLARIVERHEPLRTVFVNGDEGPRQKVRSQFEFRLGRLDLSGMEKAEQERRVSEALNADAMKPFDLSGDLMVRASFIRLSEEEGVLQFSMHHIASDGWSMGVLIREFTELYEAYLQGKADPLPEPVIRYGDYAEWQREWLRGEVLEAQLSYWEKQLAGMPEVHAMPLDHPRPAVQSFRGALYGMEMDGRTLEGLKQVARKRQATLFMMLHGVFGLLVARHGNSADVVMGTPVANRLQKELEFLVGFFVNTLVLRVDCEGGRSFGEYLDQVRRVNVEAQAHQDVPFEHVVERLKPRRSTSHGALFQLMLSMDNNQPAGGRQENGRLKGLSLRQQQRSQLTSPFDLTLDAMEHEHGLSLSFLYNSDLFEPATIERMGGHLSNLLRGVASDVGCNIEDLPLLSEAERRYLISGVNHGGGEYPRNRCLQELFEEHAQRDENAIAVVYEKQKLSYGELNRQANRLAHYLRERGVGRETLVGLCVERSPEMVTGILGILKAGGAYVPLEPEYPQERIEYMLADSRPLMVVTQASLEGRLAGAGLPLVRLDADRETLRNYSDDNLSCAEAGLSGKDLAYVIYTSGSTGRPKGVMVEHGHVQRLLGATDADFAFTPADVWTLFHSPAFDFSVWELWGALALGGRLVIVPQWMRRSPEDFYELLRSERVTVLNQTPGAFSVLDPVDEARRAALSLRFIIFGGEALNLRDLNGWVGRHGDEQPVLVNMYGITETTVHVTYRRIRMEDTDGKSGSLIGRPIADLTLYLLDPHQHLAPMGATGEIYVGGGGVARGYLNRDELTAERFLNNPYVRGERIYRSGDLGRYLPNGELEYLGRIDNQVKIRGFRIELGEIEQQLSELPGVTQAAVLMREDEPGQKRLVAYVVPAENSVKEEHRAALVKDWRAALAERLPDYMVPSAFVLPDEIPLTVNGKLDRKALPAPDDAALPSEYVPLSTETEIAVGRIWADLLKKDAGSIGATADFFELGGHSLLAIRLVGRVRAGLGVELHILDVFEASQLSSMAERVDRNHGRSMRPPIVRVERRSELLPTSFAQQRLWFIDQLGGGSVQYNIPGAMRIAGRFDEATAERVLARIVERHEPLRTVFVNGDEGPRQKVRSQFEFRLGRLDLSGMEKAEQERRVSEALNADAMKPFDLSGDLMVRASFIRLSEEEGVLQFSMHHIASDGWSMGVLIREFTELYEAYLQGKADPLPEPVIRYGDYAEWQREWLRGEVLEAQLSYWEKQLAGMPEVHAMPLDHPRPAVQSFRGALYGMEMDGRTLEGLKQVARKRQATLFMMLHGVFGLLVARHGNSADVVMGTPVANRLQKELEFLVGFFVNTLVLRVDCEGGRSFGEYLDQVRRVNVEAQAHQDVPFEHVVERLKPRRSTSHGALFQIMFSMDANQASRGAEPEPDRMKGLRMKPQEPDQVTSAFDLMLNVTDDDRGLYLSFLYNRDLFDASTVERIGGHFSNLLRGVTADAERNIEDLPMLSEAERRHLVYGLNDTAVEYAGTRCLQELFEDQVARDENAVAVIFEGRPLSYGELNRQANRLAHYLREQGVGPETLVGLCMERSPEMVAGILGILKSGGAYVPLELGYPAERLEFMISDSAPKVVVTQAGLEKLLAGVPVVRLDADRAILEKYPDSNVSCAEAGLSAKDLAYVIYTSGSTGRPKGVMNTHAAVANSLLWAQQRYQLQRQDRILQKTPFSFDVSVWEFLLPLIAGAQLVMARPGGHMDPQYLAEIIEREQITILHFVPSMLRVFLEHGFGADRGKLRLVMCSGEALPWAAQRRFEAAMPGPELHNLYGPTEAAVHVTWWRCEREAHEGIVPIGRPIGNTQIYVLDKSLQPVPQGVAGEIYIGGDGVARGYWGRPELTAERFLPAPYGRAADARMYKTGDLGRWLRDGAIEYLGRNDFQLKIRGFRIEPGEIEQQLSAVSGVGGTVVMMREDIPGRQMLVAYVVPTGPAAEEAAPVEPRPELIRRCREQLSAQLPGYMMPSAFVLLEGFPLTSSGKVDRRALPAPEEAAVTSEHVAAATPTETALQQIWQGALSIDSLSVTANFFDVGGHSLLAVPLISMANRHFGDMLELRDIFLVQTIREMARYIDANRGLKRQRNTLDHPLLLELKFGAAAVRPLFLVHPVGGYAHCYSELAVSLNYEGPVYGLQDDDETPATIESMAEKYLDAIRQVQPAGPYLLGGWSMGGVVAFEMARRVSTDLLLMFDSFCPAVRGGLAPVTDERQVLRILAAELGITDQGMTPAEISALEGRPLDDLLELVLVRGREQNRMPASFDLRDLRKRYMVMLRNSVALNEYRAEPFDGEIHLVRAADGIGADRSNGWSSVASRISVVEQSGDHFSMLHRPHVAALAATVGMLIKNSSDGVPAGGPSEHYGEGLRNAPPKI